MKAAIHEDFSRGTLPRQSSDRSLGLVFAVFLGVVALWPMLRGRPLRMWALGLGGAFVLVALRIPSLLHPLNWLWMRLGLLVSKLTNPVVTGLMFYLVFTPAAVLLRLLRKDLLRLKFDPAAKSYWIPRHPPGPSPETMRNQF